MATTPDMDLDITLGGSVLRLSALTLAVESFDKDSTPFSGGADKFIERAQLFEDYLAGAHTESSTASDPAPKIK